MGTNYYWTPPTEEPCPHCGRGPEQPRPRHIGKSSAGWCFALHVYPGEGINTLEDWKALWATGGTITAYDEPITVEEMLNTITNRSRDGEPFPADWLARNHAVPGPRGLARHAIDPPYVIGMGGPERGIHVAPISGRFMGPVGVVERKARMVRIGTYSPGSNERYWHLEDAEGPSLEGARNVVVRFVNFGPSVGAVWVLSGDLELVPEGAA